ncbi:hypothetical protein [Lacibacter sediminis]|uniref:Uncharacterized protein n=1 Tax=Lacibacter sediminis TaxID=2760713 RepID=A0A7G5XG17_9BACT|nr:hypothetical protein [Lacibacter sediminis]QNA44420.1 hypothetical protein H4075_20545 [Lacibacter sediminis]
MIRSLMFLLFLVVALDSSAQLNIDSLRLQYNQKTLRFNNRITMNGSLLEPQTVKNLMLISPEATAYYKQYLKNKRVGNVLPIFGTAAVITGIIVAQKNRTPGYITVIGGNTINLIGSLFRRKAGSYLQDAIWAYNRDVLYPRR